MRPLVVVQARLGSRRLPRKVLADLCGSSVLQRVVERCQRTEYPVVVACPTSDWLEIEDACRVRVIGWPGDEADVLGRYAAVASGLPDVDVLIRVTADCPLVDPSWSSRVARAVDRQCVPVASLAVNGPGERWGVPDGLDVEAFSRDALMLAAREATDPHDREHVTPWMRRNLDHATLTPAREYRPIKLSIDTPEDLERVRRCWAEIPGEFMADDVGDWLAHNYDERPRPVTAAIRRLIEQAKEGR